jgi:large subunit ribosomal protein L21
MNKYAILKISGNQILVEEKKEYLIPKTSKDVKPDVLLASDGTKIFVGQPLLNNVVVKYEIDDQIIKGKKLDIFKYKSKSRYRKKMGFRSMNSRLKIDSISFK